MGYWLKREDESAVTTSEYYDGWTAEYYDSFPDVFFEVRKAERRGYTAEYIEANQCKRDGCSEDAYPWGSKTCDEH